MASCRRSSSGAAAGTVRVTPGARTGAATTWLRLDSPRDPLDVERQRALPAGHGEIHVDENPGVEQRAVQFALGVVDAVALAERIETVALSGMQAARQRERVEHLADLQRRRDVAR